MCLSITKNGVHADRHTEHSLVHLLPAVKRAGKRKHGRQKTYGVLYHSLLNKPPQLEAIGSCRRRNELRSRWRNVARLGITIGREMDAGDVCIRRSRGLFGNHGKPRDSFMPVMVVALGRRRGLPMPIPRNEPPPPGRFHAVVFPPSAFAPGADKSPIREGDARTVGMDEHGASPVQAYLRNKAAHCLLFFIKYNARRSRRKNKQTGGALNPSDK